MKIKEVIDKLNTLAPPELAYEWDNVGLLCGSEEKEVTGILLTLDLDVNVVLEAKEKGANLIVGHHPILFEPLKKVTDKTPDGKVLMALIENKISYFAAHTNLDIAENGLNDLMSQMLDMKDVKILDYTSETSGIGRTGSIEPVTLRNLSEKVKAVFNAENVRVCGDENALIKRVSVCTGGGGSLINAALKNCADVYISGDLKYDQMRTCVALGLNVIDIGHYNTEIICCGIFNDFLKNAFGDKISIHISEENKNIYKFI